MIKYLDEIKEDVIPDIAKKMAAAAITAPKASGKDKVVTAIVSGEEKDAIVKKLHELCREYNEPAVSLMWPKTSSCARRTARPTRV